MHFVIIGGDGVQLLGGIYTPHPPCFGTADRGTYLLILYKTLQIIVAFSKNLLVLYSITKVAENW